MIVEEEDGNNKCQGLPTEGALMALVSSLKHQGDSEHHEFTKLFTIHFTSKRKMMSVLLRDEEKNKNVLVTKGAAEIII